MNVEIQFNNFPPWFLFLTLPVFIGGSGAAPSSGGASEHRGDGSNPTWKGSGRRRGRDSTHKVPFSLG